MIVLDVNNARTLAKLTAETLSNLIFVKARSPIVLLHFRETAPLSARLRDRAVPVLIFLVDKVDLGLHVLV